jgi:hypothetical protein
VKALADLQFLLAERVNEVSRPLHWPLRYLKESGANFSRATIVARAHSHANLGTVVETGEGLISHLPRTPLLTTEGDSYVQLK